jgi:hypothetical protein
MEKLREGKEGRAILNSVIGTAYHKVVMALFSWLEKQGEKESEKFRFIARLGIVIREGVGGGSRQFLSYF